MSHPAKTRLSRLGLSVVALGVLGACTEPLDYDLRGKVGGFSTADAALGATADRPKPDARGIISYPNYQVAVARRGDTVTQIAGRVGLPAEELARYNGIDANVTLREGEIVALPRRVSESARSSTDIAAIAGSAIDSAPATTPIQSTVLAAPTPQPTIIAQQPGPEPVRHKVARGETAYTIARLYNVPVKALGDWNGLSSDFAIREGQYLLIPVASQGGAKSAEPVTVPGAGSPTPVPPSAAKPLPDEKVSAKTPETPDVSLATQTLVSSGRLGLPVQGKIVRAYSKGKNDGIDIAAAPGDPVKAAADGSIAAITADADQVPIIVVRHPDNLLTVYANVADISVKKGDRVRRGQPIAKLRDGDKAYVHFEVREGLESVDPVDYLK